MTVEEDKITALYKIFTYEPLDKTPPLCYTTVCRAGTKPPHEKRKENLPNQKGKPHDLPV